jgi:hypothetical protein
MINKFDMTRKGCEDAQKFLKEEKVLVQEISSDGFTLVYLANDVYQKRYGK